MVSALGRTTFEDANIPVPGKSEFGADTLTRKMEGYAGFLSAFIASLRQGQMYNWAGTAFYLQTWQPGDATPVATVILNYKGLIGGTPQPIITSDIVPITGSTSADFTDGGANPNGISYGKDASGKDLRALAATLEFIYDAPQSTYRYLTVGKPRGPSYGKTDINPVTGFRRARLTTNDGTSFGVPWTISNGFQFNVAPSAFNAFVSALTPLLTYRTVGFRSQPIIGTPYFECEDVVRAERGNGD